MSPKREAKVNKASQGVELGGDKPGLYRGQSMRGERGLTLKQETFAIAVARGATLTAAYRKAYDCSNMADDTVWNNASRLADDSRVAARVSEEGRMIEKEKPHDPEQARRKIINVIDEIMSDPDTSTAMRLKAAELYGKVRGVGLYSEHIEMSDTNTDPLAAYQKLRAKMDELETDMARDTKAPSDLEVKSGDKPAPTLALPAPANATSVTPPGGDPPC